MEKENKKSLKWLWIAIALVVVAGLAAWCVIAAGWGKDVKDKWGEITGQQYGIANILNISAFFVTLFVIVALGYGLGRITITLRPLGYFSKKYLARVKFGAP